MNSKLYTKKNPLKRRQTIRIAGLLVCIFGGVILLYFLLPLISFQLYLQPALASQKIATPIPRSTILGDTLLQSLLQATTDSFMGIDYTNAKNWYPSIQTTQTEVAVTQYLLSIPKLGIADAIVSTIDNDLSKHLVQYGGTAVPPSKGNAVIFGHSTLPQFYREGDYKTILAKAHTLEVGDEIIATVEGLKYTYKIFSILIADPTDTSFFQQDYDDNYLTLITCTPPGTTWKRLIIKARIIKPESHD